MFASGNVRKQVIESWIYGMIFDGIISIIQTDCQESDLPSIQLSSRFKAQYVYWHAFSTYQSKRCCRMKTFEIK